MIAASLAISFLGAFTSTQLICHARTAAKFSSVFIWSVLGSVIFGFCGVWSLHEVAMLAYEFDIPIGVHGPLTVLSAVLAVSFTFTAMAGDMLYARYRHGQRRLQRRQMRRSMGKKVVRDSLRLFDGDQSASSTPLLQHPSPDEEAISIFDPVPATIVNGSGASSDEEGQPNGDVPMRPPLSPLFSFTSSNGKLNGLSRHSSRHSSRYSSQHSSFRNKDDEEDDVPRQSSSATTSSEYSDLRRASSAGESSSSLFRIRNAAGFIYRDATVPAKNAFFAMSKQLYQGLSPRNIAKGFVWSLAITSMHYVGIFALEIPNGYYRINPWLLTLSAINSWLVCTVGFILMGKMETHLPQQILFSVIATVGVAAMHFTGMSATTFYSVEPASEVRGFPPALAGSVVGIGFVTCIVANVLLSHSATVSRNKLAEIMWTRRELYKNIVLKEHAEAAARTRSEFIASASHEIRTPLHHLQGYSDLLAQTELTDEGRSLLTAIQRATKTLSLLTNNVLDWSKFEGNVHGEYRPTPVDIRGVCESIVTLMPNLEDDYMVEIYVVVAPDVPKMLHLDDSWIHRILMNLLSNALKFTKNGYILLSIAIEGENLVATVKDTGCGLEPQFIPEMWQPFKQGEVRGSARGTGLGLSIIRQLVNRMNGNIEVESKYEHAGGVGPYESGTTFTVTVPVGTSVYKQDRAIDNRHTAIAILSDCALPAEGLKTSWNHFGFDVTIASSISDLGDTQWEYVWAELSFLTKFKDAWAELLHREHLLILIPYDTQDTLVSLPGILTAPNIVLLQKPLLWHTFSRRILATRERKFAAAPSQALRFAPEVEVLDESSAISMQGLQQASSTKRREYNVLLVEDNHINRKLGIKMLEVLHYKTLIAHDGQDALDMLAAHDTEIDCVLMDQSMPKMDGVTATRLIRQMEEDGRLKRHRTIIAVTAVVNSQAQSEFVEAGADDFLAKPLSLEKLRDVLGLYLPAD